MAKQYYTTNCDFRFTDKANSECEREVFSDYWQEQLRLYGQEISYYVNNYALSAHDGLYGEDPTRTFSAPQTLTCVVELNENSAVLSQFGLMSDDDITLFIHISAYADVFGATAEPKSGDIIELTEYGQGRRGGRTGKLFEITDREDQDISKINQLMGHYVWMLRGKRYDYSFEPGVSAEGVSDQVYDDSFAGRLSGYTNPATTSKAYSGSADEDGANIFNYTDGGNMDSIYGEY